MVRADIPQIASTSWIWRQFLLASCDFIGDFNVWHRFRIPTTTSISSSTSYVDSCHSSSSLTSTFDWHVNFNFRLACWLWFPSTSSLPNFLWLLLCFFTGTSFDWHRDFLVRPFETEWLLLNSSSGSLSHFFLLLLLIFAELNSHSISLFLLLIVVESVFLFLLLTVAE